MGVALGSAGAVVGLGVAKEVFEFAAFFVASALRLRHVVRKASWPDHAHWIVVR